MKIKNSLKNILIGCVITCVLVLTSGQACFASAQNSNSLIPKLRQINNQRSIINQKKKQADLKLKNEKNKLTTNQQKLESAHSQLKAATSQYDSLSANLSVMESRLNKAIGEFQQLDAAMKHRIREVFKHQRYGMFELILSAKDVNSLLDIFYFEKIVIQQDYKRLQAIKAKADEISRLKAQIETQKRQVEASIREINSQRAYIQSSIAENKNMIERLTRDKSYYEKTERELASQSATLQGMIANLTKSNSSSSNNKTQKTVVTSGFIRPISGPITSPFGYRIHPIFKSRIFHSGIDIGGPNRGAIKASNDGKVIFSGWYGGYGKVVILDHGVVNGQPITTLYAHMSQINVSNGAYVKKGQTVGLEGSTGYSTGPHCHFEVRVNGKPTNPLNYVK